MHEIRVFAPAKINLYLDVLNKRKDGFHDIETIFEKIDLKDEIIIKEKGNALNVRAIPEICSQAKDNIVYKAVRALLKEASADIGLDIEIKKNVPVSAGLGGGSSDAAASLMAVNELFNLRVSKKRLFEIALDTGKDVPFFMEDYAFAIGRGAGEELEAIDSKACFFHILIKPPIPLSTAGMYGRIGGPDVFGRGNLSSALRAVKENNLELLESNYYNIFEKVLAKDSVHIDKAKGALLKAGASYSLLSGSGPTVFSSFKSREEAEAVFKKIPMNQGMKVFLAQTYRRQLWR